MRAITWRNWSGLVSQRRPITLYINIVSHKAQLVICMLAKTELGIVIKVRFFARMRVERRPMRSTLPVVVPNWQWSPICTGLSA